MSRRSCDVLVVGAGIAGLTAAAYLSRGGHKVLLIEKNDTCGGLVSSFTRDGFRFDTGIRAFEDAGIILPALRDLGIELEFAKSPVSIGVEQEILSIDSAQSLPAYREMLARLYPESTQDIDRIMAVIRDVMKHMEVLYGIENPNFKDVRNDRAYLFTELLPWLLRFLVTMRKINRMDYPVEEFLEGISSDASLRDIISQHFFKSTPTFFAMSYFSLYLDYIYPQGGTAVLPAALRRKVVEHGGEIVTGSEICEIIASESTARDANGEEYRYDTLIWAADLKTLYRITDTRGLPNGLMSRIEKRKDTLLARRGGDSAFVLFLTVNEPPESFGSIAHGHFFYTPSRAGLGELHRSDLRRMIENWNRVSHEDVLKWLADFCRLNTYEISIPALKDSGAAPAGKTGLIISVLFSYDLVRRIDESGWYDEFRTALEDGMIRALADSIYPMLANKVISRFSASPLTIERNVGSSEGAITGWSFEAPVPAVNRILRAPQAVTTPIPNVLQAGQWTYSPAGVPMSMLTGKLAADRVGKLLRG